MVSCFRQCHVGFHPELHVEAPMTSLEFLQFIEILAGILHRQLLGRFAEWRPCGTECTMDRLQALGTAPPFGSLISPVMQTTVYLPVVAVVSDRLEEVGGYSPRILIQRSNLGPSDPELLARFLDGLLKITRGLVQKLSLLATVGTRDL